MPRQAARTQLLRELLILELFYRRDEDGALLDDARLCELHPELVSEIPEQLKLLRERQWERTGADGVTNRQSSMPDVNPTISLEPRSSSGSRGSRGLHIRCPHCSNPVELLTDTPLGKHHLPHVRKRIQPRRQRRSHAAGAHAQADRPV